MANKELIALQKEILGISEKQYGYYLTKGFCAEFLDTLTKDDAQKRNEPINAAKAVVNELIEALGGFYDADNDVVIINDVFYSYRQDDTMRSITKLPEDYPKTQGIAEAIQAYLGTYWLSKTVFNAYKAGGYVTIVTPEGGEDWSPEMIDNYNRFWLTVNDAKEWKKKSSQDMAFIREAIKNGRYLEMVAMAMVPEGEDHSRTAEALERETLFKTLRAKGQWSEADDILLAISDDVVKISKRVTPNIPLEKDWWTRWSYTELVKILAGFRGIKYINSEGKEKELKQFYLLNWLWKYFEDGVITKLELKMLTGSNDWILGKYLEQNGDKAKMPVEELKDSIIYTPSRTVNSKAATSTKEATSKASNELKVALATTSQYVPKGNANTKMRPVKK